MIDIDIETTAVEKCIRIMVARIGRFTYTMGAEMSDWQTADMKRKQPFTKRNSRAKFVYTTVRPHSKKRMMKRRKLIRRMTRKGQYVGHLVGSNRPILRTELEAKLAERMKGLMEKRLQWVTGTSSGGGE